MSFPKAVGQCPIYYNHTMTGRPKRNPEHIHAGYTSNYIGCGNLPLYSFGHGLSYSNFVYESLALSADEMTADGSIRVDITVHNDSDLSGKETVMLYMRDLVGSNARPVQQLIDFKKVEFPATTGIRPAAFSTVKRIASICSLSGIVEDSPVVPQMTIQSVSLAI